MSSLETFLCISNTTWIAVSAIATVFAVLVALFLPFYQKYKMKRNINVLIKNEIKTNVNLLRKTIHVKDSGYNGKVISRLNMICAILKNINLDIWNNHKVNIAEISSKMYLFFNEINNHLENIRKSSIEIDENKGMSPYSGLIEDEIKLCLEKVDNNKIYRHLTE